MKHQFNPSYEEYRKILRNIRQSGKYMDYREAAEADCFIILRHDIEFSVERAYRMSLIEKEEGIASTYFVQITSNAYNAFSQKNMEMLKRMIQNGHRIGLHYHLGTNLTCSHITHEIQTQVRVLSDFLEYDVDRFSIHRPTEASHYYEIQVDGVINAYSKEFFTHVEKVNENSQMEVKYIADSKHQWNYGYPDMNTIKRFPKIQLLIHPYSWAEIGCGIADTFCTIADEKEKEALNDFDEETKIYCLVKQEVEKRRKRWDIKM